MKIITITLSPAFDLHCICDNFKLYSESLCDIQSYDVGGKGINISRALTANNIDNIALTILGEENAQDFLRAIKKENIACRYITASGRIRENITLHSKVKPETRISFSGFKIDEKIISQFEDILFDELSSDCIVTFTGRVPDGIDKALIKDMLLKIKGMDAKLVIDSKSFDKNDIIELKPFLIKPNEEEISIYTDVRVTDLLSASLAAKELKKQGIENIIISLGGMGAVLCSDQGIYLSTPPEINVKSTVGAGDSMIAGFLAAIQKGNKYSEALRLAVSYGSAACTTVGTNPPTKEKINFIFEKTTLENL